MSKTIKYFLRVGHRWWPWRVSTRILAIQGHVICGNSERAIHKLSHKVMVDWIQTPSTHLNLQETHISYSFFDAKSLYCNCYGRPLFTSGKMSYCQILWSFKAAEFCFKRFQSLWRLAGSSVIALSRCLSNFRVMRSLQHPILRLHDFMGFASKASYCLRNRCPELVQILSWWKNRQQTKTPINDDQNLGCYNQITTC